MQRRRLRSSSLARQVARRRFTTLLLTAAVALTAYVSINGARSERASWGETTPVVIATRPISAGEMIERDDQAVVDVPSFLVPSAAITAPIDPTRAARSVAQRAILVNSDVADSDMSAIAAALPEGTGAVTIPLDDSTPTLSAGDHVDIYGPIASAATRGAEYYSDQPSDEIGRLTTRALVISSTERQVTLAVNSEDLAVTIACVFDGQMSLVIVG